MHQLRNYLQPSSNSQNHRYCPYLRAPPVPSSDVGKSALNEGLCNRESLAGGDGISCGDYTE